jgi:hypothetical protein
MRTTYTKRSRDRDAVGEGDHLSISILRFGRWKKGKIEIGLSSCTREMTGTGFASDTHCFVDIAENGVVVTE